MHSFQITINGVNVTQYACYPFSGELTLDRSLDQAYIELRAMPRKEPFQPFSEVQITNESNTVTFVIASDEVETIIKTGLSNHKILLCEETKKLERVICPGKTFVQPLVKNYSTDVQSTPQEISTNSLQNLAEQAGLTDYIDTRYQLYELSNNNLFAAQNVNATIFLDGNTPKLSDTVSITLNTPFKIIGYAIIAENRFGEITTLARSPSYLGEQPYSQIIGYSLDISGRDLPIGGYNLTYLINIGFRQSDANPPAVYNMAAVYDIGVIPISQTTKPPLYITDVTNQLLEIAEPVLYDFNYGKYINPPRFTLDPSTAKRYQNTPCAELNFANGATLRENLDEIAGIVHCITRLKGNVIYFDPVGTPPSLDRSHEFPNNSFTPKIVEPGVYADTDALGAPVSIRSSANIEKYATHLDSFVDNLMNAQDPSQGAVSDPFGQVYRTPRALRSTTDARVTVSNCRIDTVFPIEKLEKVTVLYDGDEYDITPYVYEKSEYDLLETNGGVYPYAKSYALYYTRGQKGIDGLTFKPERSTSIGQAFQNVAIANVISAATGTNIGWGDDLDGSDVLNYCFNVTYITGIRGRVRSAKADISDAIATSAIAFNQSAPRLSSVNFGERLRGETAMLSEPEVNLVFKTQNLGAVTTSVGKLYIWNDERYYISKVSYKVWRDYIIAEMNLSRNFNQLGRYVSINNAFRQFEIDDTSQEECIVYEDYVVFTDNVEIKDITDDSLSTNNGNTPSPVVLNNYLALFGGRVLINGRSNIEICEAQTRDSENNTLAKVFLPVQSIALGNSLLFNFRFEDNYSAGNFLQNQAGYRLSRETPYGDPLYGEAKHLWFQLGSRVLVGGNIPTQTDYLDAGNKLPTTPNVSFTYTPIIATGEGARCLVINKSSRDIPNITYQLHHVTDCGLIFGKALTQRNPLVTPFEGRECYIMLLPFEINPLSPPEPFYWHYKGAIYDGFGFSTTAMTFWLENEGEKYIETEEETDIVLNTVEGNAQRFLTINKSTQTSDLAKSWAIYRRGINDGPPEFLIGANGAPREIYIYLKHDILNL